ncbi:PP2C family protein-serine/threonine phosphatase [Actinomadura formosensis]|uniref:PP2C family protein-serine/threonine phosphatase n=1 Tax=Actinomadura formosensis TaxID=60706 RepID=UPI003D92D08B
MAEKPLLPPFVGHPLSEAGRGGAGSGQLVGDLVVAVGLRAVAGPGRVLEVQGLYARSIGGALGTTVACVLIDPHTGHLTYSSAGHLPPVLAHPGGSIDLLDQATDPPLGARPYHVPRPQASRPYTPGDTLILYTDGLVERRGEDIENGLAHLTDALAADARRLDQPQLADTLLDRLGVSAGGRDDVCLLITRLGPATRPGHQPFPPRQWHPAVPCRTGPHHRN